jgi:very-short-patch-repair endonuclease
MNSLIPLVAIAVVLLVIASVIQKHSKGRKSKLKPLGDLKLTARRPLTQFEEKMFIALCEALPECTVLAQVTFQALLDTPEIADRNRFNRKSADFVICSKLLTPIAVVELDDASHNTKNDRDADRDAMLQNAGYQTIRYRKIPTGEQIQADIQQALKKHHRELALQVT